MSREYCIYCMNPVEEGTSCPVCGLKKGVYVGDPHQLPPGTVLADRYLIGRVLGGGGFGITYLGYDTRLELKVAVKEYFPTDSAYRIASESLKVSSYAGNASDRYEEGKLKFIREAHAMARMEKQHAIVTVRDYFEENNTIYIVMEYVEGVTLRDLAAQMGGKIAVTELLDILEPLFGELGIMHEQKLIHRDISPDNLMLEKGKIRLIDFGCAREAATGTETLTISLKNGFAPIEQYQHKGQGPWTDVYALSATIYFCLTGVVPPQSIDRLYRDELIPPRELKVKLSAGQERALLYGMGIRPRRRFQSMQELHAALYEGFFEEPKPELSDGGSKGLEKIPKYLQRLGKSHSQSFRS